MRGGTRRSGAHREPRGAQQRGVGDAEGGEKEVVREGRHLRPVVGAEPAPQVRARGSGAAREGRGGRVWRWRGWREGGRSQCSASRIPRRPAARRPAARHAFK